MPKSVLWSTKKNYDNAQFNWKMFADGTSIHGLTYIFGKRANKIGDVIYWIIILLIMIILVIYQTFSNVQDYLKYDVNSAQTEHVVEDLEFPTITICNKNMFRRKDVGWSDWLHFTQYFLMENVSQSLINENRKYCKSVETPLARMLNEWIQNFSQHSFVEISEKITPTVKTSLLACWWKNEEFPCSKSFVNHFSDNGICFSYNFGSAIKEIVESLFGMSEEIQFNNAVRKVFTSGQKGLKILLNVDQEQYCGTMKKWHGAGFEILTHNPNSGFSASWNPPIAFTPGYSYTVILKPTLYQRETEHLGKCINSLPLEGMGLNVHYMKDSCLMMCYLQQCWSTCKCLPAFLTKNMKNISEILGINPDRSEYDVVCNGLDNMLCLSREYFNLVKYKPISQYCPLCKEPCQDTKYNNLVTSSKLRSDYFKIVIDSKNVNSTLSDIEKRFEKNYLLIEFYFDQMKQIIVKENQKIMFSDVVVFFGSNIGLFLGMSFASLFELPYAFLLDYRYVLKCFVNMGSILSKLASIFKRIKILILNKSNKTKVEILNKSNKTKVKMIHHEIKMQLFQ